MRKLVTIQEITKIRPIEGADAIELVFIMGWQCVAKKGEFKQGDLCVYFEVDSFLPVHDERYEFLKASSYRKNEFMGEGLRIKTMRFRGELSQGLFLPLEKFPELHSAAVGENVTELLKIKKWELPEKVTTGGRQKGNKPHSIPTTDETRIQSNEQYLEQLAGHAYYMTTKMDGTSCTYYHKDGEFGVCGRNFEYHEPDAEEIRTNKGSPMWDFAYKFNLPEKMKKLNRSIAIQGEFCAPGIQKNRLKLTEPNLYVFDIVDLDTLKYLSIDEIKNISETLGLDIAPVEEEGEAFNYTLPALLERAKGKYPSGLSKEGIVVRSKENIKIAGKFNSRISFKVINNEFLLKEED